MKTLFTLLPLLVFLVAAELSVAQTRDGRLFDPGVEMTEPAEGAPDELAGMDYLLGQWDVDYRAFRADTLFRSGQSTASITFMNRGHAIMERWFCDACGRDDRNMSTLSFLAFNQVAGVWNLGTADGYSESVSVSSGSRVGEVLTLHNAVRHLGGASLTYYRTTYKPSDDGFSVLVETSTDYQATWDSTVVRRYSRRERDESFMRPRDDYGEPAPDRPREAAEFDFLIGSFDAPQQLTFPNGQQANFPSTTTAVYALDGAAILEYGWYDVDPNLPDAATSIVRLYNRAMNRWESLYMANRGNGALFFGGRRVDDEIVLGFFETDLTFGPLIRFVFHDIGDDVYHWYSESSTDLGETYQKTWIIDFARRED